MLPGRRPSPRLVAMPSAFMCSVMTSPIRHTSHSISPRHPIHNPHPLLFLMHHPACSLFGSGVTCEFLTVSGCGAARKCHRVGTSSPRAMEWMRTHLCIVTPPMEWTLTTSPMHDAMLFMTPGNACWKMVSLRVSSPSGHRLAHAHPATCSCLQRSNNMVVRGCMTWTCGSSLVHCIICNAAAPYTR